jgi:hypothetical protein
MKRKVLLISSIVALTLIGFAPMKSKGESDINQKDNALVTKSYICLGAGWCFHWHLGISEPHVRTPIVNDDIIIAQP